jgi:aminopeptidase N
MAYPNAQRFDARPTTRAMTKMAYTPDEFADLFDTVAYDKAASVIRMFWNAVGETLFKRTLNLYVTTKLVKKVFYFYLKFK